MKIHFPISLCLVTALLGAVPHVGTAAPLVSIGDNADIFFNGSSSLRWSSNIFRDEDDEVDDIIWTISPGLELNVGRGLSNFDLSFVTSYRINKYFDNDQLDSELFNIGANGTYRSSRLDLGGSVSFSENQRSSGDVNVNNDLIKSNTIRGRIDAEYRFSPKFSFGSGFSYSESSYQSPYDNRFADRNSFSVPLDLFYELTPKVDLSVGYTYGQNESEGTALGRPAFTTENHFLNVGARGNLLPKLSGFFKIGYRTNDSDRAGSSPTSTLGLNGDLTWTTTPKLTNRLGFSRNFGISGEGFSSTNTTFNLTSNYSINSFFSASSFANYTLREYENGNSDDHQYRLGARLTYTPNQYWSFGGGYTYSEHDSGRVGGSYIDHSIDFSVSLRY